MTVFTLSLCENVWWGLIYFNQFICDILIKRQKGSRTFYDIIAHIVTNRWGDQFGNISEKEWKLYNTSIKATKEVKLADFQYKINNKILVTNCFCSKSKRLIIMDVLNATNT